MYVIAGIFAVFWNLDFGLLYLYNVCTCGVLLHLQGMKIDHIRHFLCMTLQLCVCMTEWVSCKTASLAGNSCKIADIYQLLWFIFFFHFVQWQK